MRGHGAVGVEHVHAVLGERGLGPGPLAGGALPGLAGDLRVVVYELELTRLKLEAESSAHMLLLCSESGPPGPAAPPASSWLDIWLSSSRSSGGGEMLSTGRRLDGVFWCGGGSGPAPGSPAAPLAPPDPQLPWGPSAPPNTSAPEPSPPPGGWRCWGALRCSEAGAGAAVEGPEQGAPMATDGGVDAVGEGVSVVYESHRVRGKGPPTRRLAGPSEQLIGADLVQISTLPNSKFNRRLLSVISPH